MNNILDRLDLYLPATSRKCKENTKKESELQSKFSTMFSFAESCKNSFEEVNPKNLAKWRKAYYGTLNALDKKTGEESTRKSRQVQKVIFECIESIVDNNIPAPKVTSHSFSDRPLCSLTEGVLNQEVLRSISKASNDIAERNVYVDSTGWYRVGWDSLDSTHSRAGRVKVDFLNVDKIIPEPGVTYQNYKRMNYIFEICDVSIAEIFDLYGIYVSPTLMTNDEKMATDITTIIICYYLNSKRTVGRFIWQKDTGIVIYNEPEWQVIKLRRCDNCGNHCNVEDECPMCHNKSFEYVTKDKDIALEDIPELYTEYKVIKDDDGNFVDEQTEIKPRIIVAKGNELPCYKIRQLPFVPRVCISRLDSIYGVGMSQILLEMQDHTNKIYTKSTNKVLASGSILTYPGNRKLNEDDEEIRKFKVESKEEIDMIQLKPIAADIQADISLAQVLYTNAKNASGVTDSYQGKRDTTATSGKAKEISAAQTAGRIESIRVMKGVAMAGVYELAFKYMLAFSSGNIDYIRKLPNGKEKQASWNKYLFLKRDDAGELYYNDNFDFDVDNVGSLATDKAFLWNDTQSKFTLGELGNVADPRTVELLWSILYTLGYPNAGTVLQGIRANARHLPAQVEQMIMQNPEILKMIESLMGSSSGGQGGARPGSGAKPSGASRDSVQTKSNIKQASGNKSSSDADSAAKQNGGAQK